MESGREPCPYRILDDVGGAFAMGTLIILSTHLTFLKHILLLPLLYIRRKKLTTK